jgi:hypothetical protein
LSDKSGLLILIGMGALALAVVWLTRRPARQPSSQYVERRFVPVRRHVDTEAGVVPIPTPAKRYINTETTEIEWNADMLPVKIVRHREATST